MNRPVHDTLIFVRPFTTYKLKLLKMLIVIWIVLKSIQFSCYFSFNFVL